MQYNPLQFAITREDPLLEAELVRTMNAREVLLVCSAGDTVLALKSMFPDLKITTFDFNPAQLQHLRNKTDANYEQLNSEANRGLCQSGNFESLFRQWRLFFNEFICSDEKIRDIFRKTSEFDADIFNSKH